MMNMSLYAPFYLLCFLCVGKSNIYSQKTVSIDLEESITSIYIENVNGGLNIENHNEEQIKIEVYQFRMPPKEAADLQAVFGKNDNTGIGLEVQKTGNQMTIKGATRQLIQSYIFYIPEKLSIKLRMENWAHEKRGWGETTPNKMKTLNSIQFFDLENEIEIDSKYHRITVGNPNKPVLINAMMGDVDLILDADHAKNDLISISTIYGQIQLMMSPQQQAELFIKSLQGEIYKPTELDLKDRTEARGSSKLGWQYFQGHLNGGGEGIHLESTYGNILLKINK